LLSWAEPIISQLERVLAADGSAIRAEYRSASLHEDPANTSVVFRAAPDLEATWTFLEARWADSFPWPGIGELLRWARRFIGRAGKRVVRQWLQPIEAYRSALRTVRNSTEINSQTRRRFTVAYLVAVLYAVTWTAISWAAIGAITSTVVAFTLILLVLSAIPFVRSRIATPVNMLVQTIGDAYLLTSRPVHAAAMQTVIRNTLARANDEADVTVVLAHSQGAALAVRTLTARSAGVSADLLITVGAGVTLLGEDAHPVADWLTNAPDMRWINIWTAWDPVPSGPIADSEAQVRKRAAEVMSVAAVVRAIAPLASAEQVSEIVSHPLRSDVCGPEEWPVHNRASVLRDHTIYNQNIPQVIRPIAARLLDLTNGRTGTIPAVDEGHVRRVRFLGTARIVSVLLALGTVAIHIYWVEPLSYDGWIGGQVAKMAHDRLAKWQKGSDYAAWVSNSLLEALADFAYEFALATIIALTVYGIFRSLWSPFNHSSSLLTTQKSNWSVAPFVHIQFPYWGSRKGLMEFWHAAKWRSGAPVSRFDSITLTLFLMILYYVPFSFYLDFQTFGSAFMRQVFHFRIPPDAFGVLSLFVFVLAFLVNIWPNGGVRLIPIPERRPFGSKSGGASERERAPLRTEAPHSSVVKPGEEPAIGD
jgi:hypothetical protein